MGELTHIRITKISSDTCEVAIISLRDDSMPNHTLTTPQDIATTGFVIMAEFLDNWQRVYKELSPHYAQIKNHKIIYQLHEIIEGGYVPFVYFKPETTNFFIKEASVKEKNLKNATNYVSVNNLGLSAKEKDLFLSKIKPEDLDLEKEFQFDLFQRYGKTLREIAGDERYELMLPRITIILVFHDSSWLDDFEEMGMSQDSTLDSYIAGWMPKAL